jgi:hypothetical protein
VVLDHGFWSSLGLVHHLATGSVAKNRYGVARHEVRHVRMLSAMSAAEASGLRGLGQLAVEVRGWLALDRIEQCGLKFLGISSQTEAHWSLSAIPNRF